MHSVKKIWRWSCKGQFATIVIPGAKSEEPLFPSKGVIGEMKDGAHLANDACPDSPTRAAWQVACPASNSWNGRASQGAIGRKKFSAGCMK
jgi:hypothetical protein